ncbi:MAG: DNA polymerase/3'-5' exonuclease PolX [Bacillota bacterium]
MENLRVSLILREIGDLLKLAGENYFKIQSYYDVSNKIKDLDSDIDKLAAENGLEKIEGVGESLAAIINEIIESGTATKYEELKSEVPIGLLEVLELPGIGPKKVKLFHDQLGITNLEELEAAGEKQKLRELSGIGAKTEFKILDAIKKVANKEAEVRLDLATELANNLVDLLSKVKSVAQVEIVGQLRRKDVLINKLELLVVSDDATEITNFFTGIPMFNQVERSDEDKIKLMSKVGVPVEIHLVQTDDYTASLVRLTGNQKHYQQLIELAEDNGYYLTAMNLYTTDDKEVDLASEAELYNELSLPYIIPELRCGDREIELAQKNRLPQKLELDEIKGDLHVHTNWSDGGNSISEMATAAQDAGYEYLAICDHSRSLGVASGLQIEELEEQLTEVRKINQHLTDFRLLQGSEVDILSDGNLDFPSELLDQLDIVVASIHSGFNQSKEVMTERILRALENEEVDILAHPTGRLLGKREGYQVDIKRVIEQAVATNTILEINASPYRLDLSSKHLRLAKEAGAKIVINTDAHNISQLANMQFGVYNARRGLIEAEDIVNTYSLKELLKLLAG